MSKSEELQRYLSQYGISLPEVALNELILYLDELCRWGKTINLTSIRNSMEGLEKHLVDSLLPLPHLTDVRRLLDIGSGAGLPGIPLKIAKPELMVCSVDSVGKKIAFQKHIGRRLQFENFWAWNGRIESMPQQAPFENGFDLIVSRAFSSLPLFLKMAGSHLAREGRILAMKGPEGERELIASARQISEEGFEIGEIHRLKLPISKANRILIFFQRSRNALDIP